MPDDPRFHGRLHTVPLDCSVEVPEQPRQSGTLSNIAHGGALIVLPADAVVVSALEVTVHCDGEDYVFPAEVIRTHPLGNDQQCALRWKLDDSARTRLQSLFESLLHGAGPGTRRMPRVERRFQAIWRLGEDIAVDVVSLSQGGLACLAPRTLVPGTDLEVQFLTSRFPHSLGFHCQVAYAQALDRDVHRVGMKFLGVERRMARQLREFIELLLRGGDP